VDDYPPSTGEYEERVFDLLEPRVRTRIHWWLRHRGGWGPDTERGTDAAIATAKAGGERMIRMLRWKTLPTVGFRKLRA
jgi:hypothetical protein